MVSLRMEPQEVIEERTEEVAEEDRNAENDESNLGACCDEDLAEADQSLDSSEIIISDVRGPHKRFSISKETKGELKESEAGTSSYSCDDAFVIIVGTEGEAVGKRIAAESADELVLHGSEEFVECNGNDNDNTCCNADELGAEALIEDGECSFSRVENESVEKTEMAGWDDQKSVQEHGTNEVSSTSPTPKKSCSSNAMPKASSSKTAQVQWAGSDDDTDVVIGDEAGVIESTKELGSVIGYHVIPVEASDTGEDVFTSNFRVCEE
ncbi:hypothetical protein J437_LFUL007648 [Ladona fulva]|uniref:Uncharacterized protein n=1 Tax=Ladona fulva TaxID=123851 RepID=A0A8K0P3Y6_LADFU|nr:hypothetical protein J437_LFUL007648 [Ladona fulva]